MWTRAELKESAKTALKPYYWWGVLACFVAGLLGGGSGGSGISFGNGFNSSIRKQYTGGRIDAETLAVLKIVLVVAVFITIGVLVFSILVSNVVYVGMLNFFLESRYRGESAGIGALFFGFAKGKYGNIVKIMFLKGLYQGLWTLLLIIPGIVKSYEYYMVPYLLADDPTIDMQEAFRLSKKMMDGNKFSTFVLELSFMGWYFLGLLACCIGGIFVNPYYHATLTELYFKLKQNIFGPARQEPVYIE